MAIQGHLAIVVGHTKNSGGAKGISPINASEYVYNTNLADMIKQYGEARGHMVDVFFKDENEIGKAYKQDKESAADACVELHFNAYNGTVQGTETLYIHQGKEKELLSTQLAQVMQRQICIVFSRPTTVGGTNRGVKVLGKEDRGYGNLTQLKTFPSILIEPFFGDNTADAQLAVDKKQDLANAIIIAFEEWLEIVRN
jgi:N-acetylmuramoyl-L-alanine amidase